ncbi:hypothetical protein Dimus_020660 [Dionaea muscipula]
MVSILRLSVAVSLGKQKCIRLIPRSLLEKVKRTTVEDGDSRVMVVRRRSSRLSPSLPSSCPYLGLDVEVGLPPIGEVVESIEVEAEDGDSSEMQVMPSTASEAEDDGHQGEEDGKLVSSSMPFLRPISRIESIQGGSSSPSSGSPPLSPAAAANFCQNALDAGGQASVWSLSLPPLAEVDRDDVQVADSLVVRSSPEGFSLSCSDGGQMVGEGLAGEHGGGDMVAGEVLPEPLSTVCTFPFPLSCAVLSSPMEDGSLTLPMEGRDVHGDDVGQITVIGSALIGVNAVGCTVSGCAHSPWSVCCAALKVGLEVPPTQIAGGDVLPATATGCVSHYSVQCDDDGLGVLVGSVGGGKVSEEDRVLPLAREALRPQPTDGLRQPSSAPVEPASAVEGGSGQDGCSEDRSYAHVGQADR